MKCLRCKKECLESELIDGFCYDCVHSTNSTINPQTHTLDDSVENEYSRKINIFVNIYRSCGIIICLLFSFIYAIEATAVIEAILIAFIVIAIILITSFFIEALGVIIQLLEDIKNK
jgi:uncharacterized protein YacL